MSRVKASTLRALVATLLLVIVIIGYVNAVGLGNLSDIGVGIIAAICPLGYVETLLASKTFVPQAFLSFLAVVLIIIALGRVFCAWICPIPLVQRLFPKLLNKRGNESLDATAQVVKTVAGNNDTGNIGANDSSIASMVHAQTAQVPGKPNRFKLDSRYIVLGGALVSTLIFGFPVFCLVCPVGLILATLLFVMRLFAFGEPTWTLLAFPAILMLELVLFRRWCSVICPLGALISLLAGLNRTFRPHIDDSKCLETATGTKCQACAASCDENINVRSLVTSAAPLNNCTKCRNCSEVCPSKAITFPFLAPKESTKK